MNPGSTNNKPPQKIDLLVERINRKIARLLGKKGKLPPTKKTSNTAFSLIILSFSVLLWLATGFYYLAENQFGVILQNGKLANVVKGIKVGFTAPYPFGSIEIIDGSISDLIDIGKMSLTSTVFTVLSQDLEPVVVDAKFAYQIVEPQLTFKTLLQQQDSLDTFVAWQVQVKLHDYFVQKRTDEILKSNLTVAANEIKNELNVSLANLGIKINKLNIYSLKTLSMLTAKTTIDSQSLTKSESENANQLPLVATQLLQQADLYKRNLMIDTQVNINQFNQLLPQYRTNQHAIVAQMYYDVLGAIPVAKTNDYPLLNLPLSQLLLKLQESPLPEIKQKPAATTLRERHFGREVSSERDGSENE